ncbi:MAG: RNA polymerase sporulation sigma factor SigH [Clostridia bacterium]|nr:RNA polymerase sporulation sigma factor SigH [Clostridia bacterium]
MEARQYDVMTDENVVRLAQSGDTQATDYLLNKFKPLVTLKCRPYFLIGADRDDINQEGMIGLYKALQEFDPERSATFSCYAELKIQNQVMSAVRATSRQKHIPLNYYVSLQTPVYEDGNPRTLMDTLVEQKNVDPMELLIGQEDLDSIEQHLLPLLSPLERDVFYAYVEGKSYQEIANSLGRSTKSIDNTIQRLKFKMEDVLRTNGILIGSAEADERRAQARERRRESVRVNAREHARKMARNARNLRKTADGIQHRKSVKEPDEGSDS